VPAGQPAGTDHRSLESRDKPSVDIAAARRRPFGTGVFMAAPHHRVNHVDKQSRQIFLHL